MLESSIAIRRVDPIQEGDRIRAVLERNLPPAAARERFDWLYLGNPDGTALVWLAEDSGGNAIGTSAAHPRRMRVAGRTVTALNLSDFAFDTAYRTLGPALRLLRATLEPVRRGEFAFSYDYPSRAMHALYRRMGGPDLGPAHRWMRPAAAGKVARKKLGPVIGDVVGAAVGAGLRLRDSLSRGMARGLAVEPLEGEPDDEFDALDAAFAELAPVRGVRDAAWVRWRLCRHTMWPHQILCARRGGKLAGYAALRPGEDGALVLVDLFAGGDDGVQRALVAGAADAARAAGAEALHVELLAASPAEAIFRRLGFMRREDGPGPVPYAAPDGPHAEILADPANWWLMGSDRDI